MKGIYTVKQCADSSDVTIAIQQVTTEIHRNQTMNRLTRKLYQRLIALQNLKTKKGW